MGDDKHQTCGSKQYQEAPRYEGCHGEQREEPQVGPDQWHKEDGSGEDGRRQPGGLARSSPTFSAGGRDVRTEMWLEQHTEQMRGGQFPPGFVRSPLMPGGATGRGGMGIQARNSGVYSQQSRLHQAHQVYHPHRSHHPRSGSYGGNSYTQTRQSSPSQWSLSQYSQSHGQCATPRSGVSGSFGVHGKDGGGGLQGNKNNKSGRQVTRGLSLSRSQHAVDRSGYPIGGTVGTMTPPALQITSPVTPRDYSSGYNSPRISEDLQRYTSDEFKCGGQVRQRERRSLDAMCGPSGALSSGGLSPHSGGMGSTTPNYDQGRSSFKSLVNYLDTRQASVSERSGGMQTPRSCSSFEADGEEKSEREDECTGRMHGDVHGGGDGAAQVGHAEGDINLLACQMKEKATLFPGSFRESLLLNSLQPETTPFIEKSRVPSQTKDVGRRSSCDEGSVSSLSVEERGLQMRQKRQQQPDVFSFPVDTSSSRARGMLGGGTTGSWPNFQQDQEARRETDAKDFHPPVDDVVEDQLDHIGDIDCVDNLAHEDDITDDVDDVEDFEDGENDENKTTSGAYDACDPTSASPDLVPHIELCPALSQDGEMSPGHEQVEFEEMTLRIIHRKNKTGFEFERELPLRVGDDIAGRFRIVELLGQAAFSRAVQAVDMMTGQHVCLKVVKNSKDYFDQSLDEIRLLRHVNQCDPRDERGIVRLYDYFYYAEHLILVTELLRANLYEFSKHDRTYFTPERLKQVASQLLSSVAYMHSLSLIHADLKPENILMKSYATCQIKLIDLGSSFFNHDKRVSYVVQSRSYRAPEVILGCNYDYKIDIWSIGCILVELAIGDVLFNDCSGAQMLARMESVMGSMPAWMRGSGRFAKRYFLADGRLFEQNVDAGVGMGRTVDVLHPQPSSLNYVLDGYDKDMADFISSLLALDPNERISAEDALQHPYLCLS